MIDLYYAPTPNGWKISIMLEECEMDYQVTPVNLGKGDQFTPEFLKIIIVKKKHLEIIIIHDFLVANATKKSVLSVFRAVNQLHD